MTSSELAGGNQLDIHYQIIIDIGLSFILLLVGWVLKVIWDAIKDLQRTDKQLSSDLSAIHILVAGDYVKRDYFEKKVDAIFKKLDSISESITENRK